MAQILPSIEFPSLLDSGPGFVEDGWRSAKGFGARAEPSLLLGGCCVWAFMMDPETLNNE